MVELELDDFKPADFQKEFQSACEVWKLKLLYLWSHVVCRLSPGTRGVIVNGKSCITIQGWRLYSKKYGIYVYVCMYTSSTLNTSLVPKPNSTLCHFYKACS